MHLRNTLLLVLLVSTFFAQAQNVTTSGKEFYLSFLSQPTASPPYDSVVSLHIYLTAIQNTTGVIANTNIGYYFPFTITGWNVNYCSKCAGLP